MSKSKKNVVRNESVGPFTVVVDVYGEYQTGSKASHVNPQAYVRMTLHDSRLAVNGGSVSGALDKMRVVEHDGNGKKIFSQLPFYKIVSVTDHGKVYQTCESDPVEVPAPSASDDFVDDNKIESFLDAVVAIVHAKRKAGE